MCGGGASLEIQLASLAVADRSESGSHWLPVVSGAMFLPVAPIGPQWFPVVPSGAVLHITSDLEKEC